MGFVHRVLWILKALWIGDFHNVFKLMDIFLLPKPSDQPFHSPASFNVISIAGIHFAYISCCYVRQTSDKFCSHQEQPFVNRVCMKCEYITKVPYCFVWNDDQYFNTFAKCPREFYHRFMYIAPSSEHSLLSNPESAL